jgi:RIO1 family
VNGGSKIEDILSPQGYQVEYVTREKYPGSESTTICIATKDGVKHYAFKVCPPDHPDHHRRIQTIKDSTPRMAKIVGPIEDVVLSVEARGQNLWGMDICFDPGMVEDQLREFALWTQAHGLIHGDLRPWNVFYDHDFGIQVIDWHLLSAFVDDLLPQDVLPARRSDLLGDGHYAKFHPTLVERGDFTEIDLTDARLIGKLLRAEIGLGEAWPGSQSSRRPSWCKP